MVVAGEDQNDRKWMGEIVDHLRAHNIYAVHDIGDRSDAGSGVRSICRCTPYIIPIFSEKSFKDKQSVEDKLFFQTILEVMTGGIDDSKVKVVPVLNKVSGDKLPNFMKWVVCLDTDEKDFMKNILAVIRGIL